MSGSSKESILGDPRNQSLNLNRANGWSDKIRKGYERSDWLRYKILWPDDLCHLISLPSGFSFFQNCLSGLDPHFLAFLAKGGVAEGA